jgi:integrase/recombinase XerD
MAASHLGIIIQGFALDLQARGYVKTCIQAYTQIVEHFSRWLKHRAISVRRIDCRTVTRFMRRHLPRCSCPVPAPTHPRNCSAALGCLLRFLREREIAREPAKPKATAAQKLVTEYDNYLGELGGLSPATRLYRQRYAREFLANIGSVRSVDFSRITPTSLRAYVRGQARKLKPASVRVLVVSLRSFLRFLALTGKVDPVMTQALPQPAPWLLSSPPQTLSDSQLRTFLQSFDRSSSSGRRDFAIALLMSHVGLRTHEVAGLLLEDWDWQNSTLRLRETKQRRERLVPIPSSANRAIAHYLNRGRPPTCSRALFVRHHLPYGSPLAAHHVRGAMRRAFARSAIRPDRVHLLRHTLATRLHAKGIGLKAVADLLRHQSLDTTARYARVDIEQLRQAALPWS